METKTEQTYRPFSNGSEQLGWQEANCFTCKFFDIEKPPICKGDEYVSLGEDMTEEIANFIGTQRRYTQEDGQGFCTLAYKCKHWAEPDSDAELPTPADPNQLSLF